MAAASHTHRAKAKQRKALEKDASLDSILGAAGPTFEKPSPKKQPPVKLEHSPRGYQVLVKSVYNNVKVQIVVAFLITANFVVNIIEKQIWPSGDPSVRGGRQLAQNFSRFEWFFNIVFSVELVANMYAHWFGEFWESSWNVFDFVTVTTSWLFQLNLPLPKSLRLMRMVRALKVFRLFKRVKSLRKILEALARAVPGVINAFLITMITMCIYAILGVDFFSTQGRDGEMEFEWCSGKKRPSARRTDVVFDADSGMWAEEVTLKGCPKFYTDRGNDFGHEYFGNFFKALFTMFQVLTGDGWSAIARPLMENWGGFGTSVYFVSFILLHSIVLINVVVAVLLEKMVDDEDWEDDFYEEEFERQTEAASRTQAEEPLLVLKEEHHEDDALHRGLYARNGSEVSLASSEGSDEGDSRSPRLARSSASPSITEEGSRGVLKRSAASSSSVVHAAAAAAAFTAMGHHHSSPGGKRESYSGNTHAHHKKKPHDKQSAEDKALLRRTQTLARDTAATANAATLRLTTEVVALRTTVDDLLIDQNEIIARLNADQERLAKYLLSLS